MISEGDTKQITYLTIDDLILSLHRVLVRSFAISTLHYQLNGNLYVDFDQGAVMMDPCLNNLRILRVGHNYKGDKGLRLLVDYLTL